MVSSGRKAIVCILLLFSAAAGAHSQSAVEKSPNSTISGKVTVGGKGVAGVVVGLVLVPEPHRKEPTRFRATTDDEGIYKITNVRPATYDVVASAPAFVATDGLKTIIVGKNENIENIDITLLRGGVITGKVTDADGNPVIEEWVQFTPLPPGPRPPYFRSNRTDDRGVYRAFGIPAGKYKVYVGNEADLAVGPSSVRAGHTRTYHPSAVDSAEATAIEVSEGSEAINVDITLARPPRRYSARGRIIDAETSKPMPALRFGVQLFFQNGSTASSAGESNTDGEFNVENLAPGKYAVYVEAPAGSAWHADPVRFEVTDQDVDGLILKTAMGASVSGVVILEGTDDPKVRANLAGGRILGQILSDFIGQTRPSSNIQPNGSFIINGLPAGRLMLQLQLRDQFRIIRVERDGIPYLQGIDIKEREQVTGLRVVVGQANGAIRGVVKIPDGLVLPATTQLFVGVRRTEDNTPNSYGSPVAADTRGQFLIDGLVAGTYEISVAVFVPVPPDRRPRIPRTTQTVVVTNGAVVDVTITLQLPKPAPTGP